MTNPKERLEELRTEIHAERISYGELAELQGLVEHIDPFDVELLEWAGVTEENAMIMQAYAAEPSSSEITHMLNASDLGGTE